METIAKPRLVIIDKNPLVISALRERIEREQKFELVLTLTTGTAFVEAVGGLEFDVAILGWNLPDMSGGDVLADLQRRKITAKVVVFSGDNDVSLLKQTIRLGAMGFCWQGDDPDILFETISAVSRGRLSFPYIDVTKVEDTPLSRLTNREKELLKALADGWTNGQIAARIGISENTVKYHLKNLYEKLEVSNRAMAVGLYFTESRRYGS
ncbi:MAG: LuxR C-terminal-related transcriptional regulator [Rhizobiaceae bacterium]